jgi:hypothetical protein
MASHPWCYRMWDLVRWVVPDGSSNASSRAGAPDDVFGTHTVGLFGTIGGWRTSRALSISMASAASSVARARCTGGLPGRAPARASIRIDPDRRQRHPRFAPASGRPLQVRVRGTHLAQVSSAVNVAHSRLPIQPFVEMSQSSFVWDVLTPHWAVRLSSATPADRHPPVCLRRMMLVEPSAYLRCFR